MSKVLLGIIAGLAVASGLLLALVIGMDQQSQALIDIGALFDEICQARGHGEAIAGQYNGETHTWEIECAGGDLEV